MNVARRKMLVKSRGNTTFRPVKISLFPTASSPSPPRAFLNSAIHASGWIDSYRSGIVHQTSVTPRRRDGSRDKKSQADRPASGALGTVRRKFHLNVRLPKLSLGPFEIIALGPSSRIAGQRGNATSQSQKKKKTEKKEGEQISTR